MYFKTELRNFFDFCKRHTWIRWLTSLQLMWWAGCQKFQWLKSYSWMKIKSQMSLFICIKRKWVQFSLSSLQQDQMLCLQLHDWQCSIKILKSLIMKLQIKLFNIFMLWRVELWHMRKTSESDHSYMSVMSHLLITCWIERAFRTI